LFRKKEGVGIGEFQDLDSVARINECKMWGWSARGRRADRELDGKLEVASCKGIKGVKEGSEP